MLIGVVGLNGSGKDTLAQYLVAKYSFAHIDLGQEIRDELKRQERDFLDREEMVALGNEMRHVYGPDYWCKLAMESMKSKDMVITSIRNPSEADAVKKKSGIIVGVFADRKTRFDRTVRRVKEGNGSHGDVQSFEEFVKREEREMESPDLLNQQLFSCINMAEYKINNDGSEKELDKRIDDLIEILKALI